MKAQVRFTVTNVKVVRLVGSDPNGLHKDKNGGDVLEIELNNGVILTAGGCSDCGWMTIYDTKGD